MDHFKSLKKIDLFRHLTDDELKKVSSLCHEVHFPKNKRIIDEGVAGDEVYIIFKGLVGIDFRISEGNYIQQAYHAMQGEVFGELALFAFGNYNACARNRRAFGINDFACYRRLLLG